MKAPLNPYGTNRNHAPRVAFFARRAGARTPSNPSVWIGCVNSLCNALGIDLPSRRLVGAQLDANARDMFDHARSNLDQALAECRELAAGQQVRLWDR
jgi:hypothetical protein